MTASSPSTPEAPGGTQSARERRLTRPALLLLIVVTALAYSRTFDVPFVFDDRRVITENPLVRDVGLHFTPWRWDERGANASQLSGLRTRWFAMLTLAVDFRLHGLRPAGYHVTNLAIHLLATLTLFDLVRRTLRLPALAASKLSAKSDRIALLVSALFALHPVQTQAVTYVTQRMASLTAALCLLALWAHLRARTAEPGLPRVAFAALAVVAVALAMLTKQNAFTFPLVVLLFDSSFLARRRRLDLRWLAAPLLAMLIIPLESLALSGGAQGMAPKFAAISRETEEIARDDYLYTQTRVVVTYLRLLVLPVRQNLDYDIRLSRSPTEPAVVASSLFLLAIAGYGCFLLASRRPRDPAWRLAGFGILWFFVTLAVEAGLVPITDLLYEHRLYLPSVGIFLSAVCATFLLVPERHERLATTALATAALVLACATFARNEVWRDELRLWRDALAKSPNKTRVLNNSGTAFKERQRYREAEALFRRTLELEPENHTALRSLGELSRRKGDRADAEQFYRRALAQMANDWISIVNLGDLALERNDSAEAIRLYEQAAALEPRARLPVERLAIARGEAPGAEPGAPPSPEP